MNLVLLTANDYCAPHQVCLRDRRAEHIKTVLRAEVGQAIKVGLLNGNLGRARVVSIDAGAVTLALGPMEEPPPPTLPLTLLLGLPRPRMLQRTLQTLATLGVQRLCLLQTARVEKSYWQTPLLQPDAITHQLHLGLEQARATQMPEIIQYPRLRPFMEDVLPKLAAGKQCLIAHPGPYPAADNAGQKQTLLAVGPEGGFIDTEVQAFCNAGFNPIQLGKRILRVETAIPVLLAKLF